MASGIYGFFDSETNECLYVGQSSNMEKRRKSHLRDLANGRHRRKDFVQWVANGGTFFFKVLQECENTQWEKNLAEIYWFEKLSPKFYGVVPTENYVAPSNTLTRSVVEKQCPFCGVDFVTRSGTRESSYCSKSCGHKSHFFKNEASYPAKETMERLYLEESLTTTQVAEILHCSQPTVTRLLKEYSIMARGRGGRKSTYKASLCGHTTSKRNRKWCDPCIEAKAAGNHADKVEWPDDEQLLVMAREHGYVGTAKLLNCSNNAVKKRLQRRGLL